MKTVLLELLTILVAVLLIGIFYRPNIQPSWLDSDGVEHYGRTPNQ